MMKPHLIVVGATSSVAQALIRVWAARCVSLTLVARNAAELARVAADARVRGASRVVTVSGDLTQPDFITRTVAMLSELGAAPKALIAHGSLTDSLRADADLDYLASELNTNFVSAALWAQALAEHFTRAEGGGAIAVISSVAGDRGRASNHAYGAAKAGLTAFC